MLYQSLKLTNGIWVLAELRIQPSNPSFTVRPFPCLPPKQPQGGSEPRLLPALPSPLSARSLGWAGWSCGTSAMAGPLTGCCWCQLRPLCQSWRLSRMQEGKTGSSGQLGSAATFGFCWAALLAPGRHHGVS